ncbi:MAG TPA: pterin-4-alpha-carbinolamine dehydratase [Flavobacteriales bacterium]|nr:pterin-4-alpha-carbinolamine dehydratase [Flavobacteriales bacterium]|tara:strand:+ start:2163 stop:2402 length:240 start_codon:yes stop_codon:yes gene_type:complete
MAWNETSTSMVREFQFPDFRTAMTFLNRVADLAEDQGHHPEIFNVYGRVRLTLTTHDAGNTVTSKDRRLAAAIDALTES